jgi:hypothetical protein
VVDAAHPDGGVGQVDDGVAAAILPRPSSGAQPSWVEHLIRGNATYGEPTGLTDAKMDFLINIEPTTGQEWHWDAASPKTAGPAAARSKPPKPPRWPPPCDHGRIGKPCGRGDSPPRTAVVATLVVTDSRRRIALVYGAPVSMNARRSSAIWSTSRRPGPS